MKKIREYRMKANLSQGMLAEKLNVKQPSVSQWERGTSYPSAETAKKLSKILDMPLGLVFDEKAHEDTYDLPVYSRVRADGEWEICTKPGCSLRVTDDDLRMLIPCAELSDHGLTPERKGVVDPERFFGFYCEGGNQPSPIAPNSVNLIYRTDTPITNAIHLVCLEGKDGCLVRLIQNERGVLVVLGNVSGKCRYFQIHDLKNGSLVILGIVVENRKRFFF